MRLTPSESRKCNRRWGLPLVAVLSLGSFTVGLIPSRAFASSTQPQSGNSEQVIVRIDPPKSDAVRAALEAQGAKIIQHLSLIDAYSVSIASGKRSQIATIPGVLSIADDALLRRTDPPTVKADDRGTTETRTNESVEKKTDKPTEADKADNAEEANQSNDPGSLESIARVTGARALWKKGITGRGVDVALIDTGITPVSGAPVTVNGADLSTDAQVNSLRFLDGFGHGTHMAGIIGGRDAAVIEPQKAKGAFVGIAPGSRVINVKVGAMDGSVHSSQVIAALDWIVQNSHANGLNIRVVNLSYGAPATTDWTLDPLAWAAEVAWRRGIVVVAAAGNEGPHHELASPAYSPQILAVGATEVETGRGGRSDYAIAPYTSTGKRRRPDLYVPGGHVISLRVKGSFIDTLLAQANISDQLTRGTGTSQATAVASGLVALLIEAFPSATPDQIKAILTSGRDQDRGKRDLTGIETSVDLKDAWQSGSAGLPTVKATDPFAKCGAAWCRGVGDGSLGLVAWAQSAWNGSAWSGSQWSGSQWSGSQWSGSQWSGNQWSGSQWSGSQWSGSQWSGSQWSGSQWSGSQWSGSQWSGSQWSGSQWSGSQWSGSQWSNSAWSSTWAP